MKYLSCAILFLMLSYTSSAQLIVNEVLYDPSNSGLTGDANGDGVYDQTNDEFIEFVNKGTANLNVSKYKIYDLVLATSVKTLRHTMGNNVILPPNGALVVFGGGTAVGTFGGAIVENDIGTAGLSLGNTGEAIIIEDSLGNRVDSVNTDVWSDNPNESYTLNPDVSGIFVQHHLAMSGVLFSPGTRIDGTPFATLTGINTGKNGKATLVYPNPTAGMVNVVTDFSNDEILIYDYSGKIVGSQKINSGKIDLSNFSDGLYMLKGSNPMSGILGKVLLAR